jgi:hypothetical protein
LRNYIYDNGEPKLVIRLGADVIKRGKVAVGDTLDLLVAEDKSKVLVKKSQKGWKLKKSSEASKLTLPWGDRRLFDFTIEKPVRLEHRFEHGGITLDLPPEKEE